MMKWNIDCEIAKLEPSTAPGTQINRVLADVASMKNFGVKPTPAQIDRGHGNIWVVALGYSYMPKAFFYGHTIREAFLKARKAAKQSKLAKHTPWGSQAFIPKKKVGKHRSKEAQKRRSEKRAVRVAGTLKDIK